MKVIVRDRRQGKTTDLIKWMLEGHIQRAYPQWNRVIVATHRSAVVHTSRMIDRVIQETDWDACAASDIHLPEGCVIAHRHIIAQVRKAVWDARDLRFNLQGIRAEGFEYAIDDFEGFSHGLTELYKPPTINTMTGELIT